MSDINSVTLSGRLTAKPEVTYAKSGTAVCNFSVCVSNYDKNAEKKEKPNFFNLVCFGHTAEALVKFRDKGDSVFVAGQLQQDSWVDKQSGAKRTAVKVVVNHVVFGRAKKSEQASAPAEQRQTEPEPERDVDNLYPETLDPGDVPF